MSTSQIWFLFNKKGSFDVSIANRIDSAKNSLSRDRGKQHFLKRLNVGAARFPVPQ